MAHISAFYGVVIYMYWNERDHPVAYFHAYHAGRRASVSVDGTDGAGGQPGTAGLAVRAGMGRASPRGDPGELGPGAQERAPARHPAAALGLSG